MRRTIVGLGMVAGAFLASTGTAHAQAKTDLGQKGQFILSADRLIPVFSYQKVKTGDDDNSSNSESNASISLLTSNFSHRTVFDVPRAALDYAVIDHLTVGGSVFVAFDLSHDFTSTTRGNSTTVDGAKGTLWGFAPRVGYVLPLSSSVAFWPRGGFSYISGKTSAPTNGNVDSSVKYEQLALDLEPMFVLSPVPHFGITVGPVIDIPLTGKYKTEVTTNGNTVTNSVDATQLYIGATAGLLGYF